METWMGVGSGCLERWKEDRELSKGQGTRIVFRYEVLLGQIDSEQFWSELVWIFALEHKWTTIDSQSSVALGMSFEAIPFFSPAHLQIRFNCWASVLTYTDSVTPSAANGGCGGEKNDEKKKK